MVSTVNISLPPMQKAWLENRRDTGGYTSTSDVIQDLIRQAQDADEERLRREFDRLQGKVPAATEPAPIEAVVAASRRVKRKYRLDHSRS